MSSIDLSFTNYLDKGWSKYALDCASSRSVLFARSPQIFNRNKQTTFKGEGVTSNTSIRSRVSVALCGLIGFDRRSVIASADAL
jgi:hypothetical protein